MNMMEAIGRSISLKNALSSVNMSRNASYNYFKPLQAKTLLSCLKSDVLAILPTGYGKSLIFECLPRLVDITTCTSNQSGVVVISPLNSIILEQKERYGNRAIEICPAFIEKLRIHKSLCLSSSATLTTCSCDGDVKEFLRGDFLYLIGHPESFLEKTMFIYLRNEIFQNKICHIVVDEAHCIDKWGSQFRTDFSKIQDLRSVLPRAKILALTATASVDTQHGIKKSLLMKDAVTYQTCIKRQNIKISVKRRPNYVQGSEESFMAVVRPFIEELSEKKELYPKTVLYSTLKWCGLGFEECCRQLTAEQTKSLVAQYHASCTNEMKGFVINQMGKNGSLRLLFATEAYSMGTDTPNIQRIIHFGVPKSLEIYMQEIGRSGRDGKDAAAIMFFNNNDVAKNVLGMEEAMPIYCRTDSCRWEHLCTHFGCTSARDIVDNSIHSCCDNCAMKCACLDCKANTHIQEDFNVTEHNDKLKLVLAQYFEAENSIVASPYPSLYTGLSSTLIKKVITTKAEDIRAELGFLEQQYTDNIIAIVESFEI